MIHANCTRINGFFSNVSYCFQNLWNLLDMILLKRSSQKSCLNLKFVTNVINSESSNFKLALCFGLVRFWNYSQIVLHSVQWLLKISANCTSNSNSNRSFPFAPTISCKSRMQAWETVLLILHATIIFHLVSEPFNSKIYLRIA